MAPADRVSPATSSGQYAATFSPVVVASGSSGGFDWKDAGIAAGLALGLMLLLLSGRKLVVHRKSETAPGSEVSVVSS